MCQEIMIARVRILLPYSIYVPVDEVLEPIKVSQDGMDITLHPPMQSKGDAGTLTFGNLSLDEINENIRPLE